MERGRCASGAIARHVGRARAEYGKDPGGSSTNEPRFATAELGRERSADADQGRRHPRPHAEPGHELERRPGPRGRRASRPAVPAGAAVRPLPRVIRSPSSAHTATVPHSLSTSAPSPSRTSSGTPAATPRNELRKRARRSIAITATRPVTKLRSGDSAISPSGRLDRGPRRAHQDHGGDQPGREQRELGSHHHARPRREPERGPLGQHHQRARSGGIGDGATAHLGAGPLADGAAEHEHVAVDARRRPDLGVPIEHDHVAFDLAFDARRSARAPRRPPRLVLRAPGRGRARPPDWRRRCLCAM